MKKSKALFMICMIYIVITGAINLIGYFNLPEKMASQFSFRGGSANTMPKSVYLLFGFALVLLLSLYSIKSEREQKIKYFLVDSIIVVANIILIIIQL